MYDIFQDDMYKTGNNLIYPLLYSHFDNEDDFRFNLSEGHEYPFIFESFDKKDKMQKINILPLDEKSTSLQTIYKDYSKQIFKNTEKEGVKNFYSFEIIKEILQNSKNFDFSKIQSNFKKDSRIENAENMLQLIKKKRKRSSNSELLTFDNKIKYGFGRKKTGDISKRDHNKFSSDNIIKKIKAKLFQNAIIFVNNILDNKNKNMKLKELDYQYINSIKKDKELESLRKPLKEILSKKISPKFNNFPKDTNKKIIDYILESQKNNEVLMFILNLPFRDWIDLFIMKKNLKEFENLNNSSCQKIEEKMPKINDLLDKILEKNTGEYLSSFIFYLYNYERYFTSKRKRNQRNE